MNIEKLLQNVISAKCRGDKVLMCYVEGDKVAIMQGAYCVFLPTSENLLDVTKFDNISESALRSFKQLDGDEELARYEGNIQQIGKVKAWELKSANKSCYVNPKLLEVFDYGKKYCNAELWIKGGLGIIRVVENGEVIANIMPMRRV